MLLPWTCSSFLLKVAQQKVIQLSWGWWPLLPGSPWGRSSGVPGPEMDKVGRKGHYFGYFFSSLFNIALSSAPQITLCKTMLGSNPEHAFATSALAVRRSNHSARSHPHSTRFHPQSARSHPQSTRSHSRSARSHPQVSYRSHPPSARFQN